MQEWVAKHAGVRKVFDSWELHAGVVASLLRVCSGRMLHSGEPLVAVHTPADHLYIVLHGALQLEAAQEEEELARNRVDPGGCFGAGDMVLDGGLYQEHACACEPNTKLMVLSKVRTPQHPSLRMSLTPTGMCRVPPSGRTPKASARGAAVHSQRKVLSKSWEKVTSPKKL